MFCDKTLVRAFADKSTILLSILLLITAYCQKNSKKVEMRRHIGTVSRRDDDDEAGKLCKKNLQNSKSS